MKSSLLVFFWLFVSLVYAKEKTYPVFLNQDHFSIDYGHHMCMDIDISSENLFNATLWRNGKVVKHCSMAIGCHLRDETWVTKNNYYLEIYPIPVDKDFITVLVDYDDSECGVVGFIITMTLGGTLVVTVISISIYGCVNRKRTISPDKEVWKVEKEVVEEQTRPDCERLFDGDFDRISDPSPDDQFDKVLYPYPSLDGVSDPLNDPLFDKISDKERLLTQDSV